MSEKQDAINQITKIIDEFQDLSVNVTRLYMNTPDDGWNAKDVVETSSRLQRTFGDLFKRAYNSIQNYSSIEDQKIFNEKISEQKKASVLVGLASAFAGNPEHVNEIVWIMRAYIPITTDALTKCRIHVRETWKDIVPIMEVLMGNKVNIGDFTGISGQVQIVVGDYNSIVSKLDNEGKTELAQALSTLTTAVLKSQNLSDEEKQEQVQIINDVGEEAAKPKQNKSKLKMLCNGLMATLQAVPDVAKAVVAVMPVLSQLHL